jgi:outer membrane receptor protein involved in Fe transport
LRAQGFDDFEGDTDGRTMSTGARGAVVLEPADEIQFRVGTDFRLIDQVITEHYTLRSFDGEQDSFTTNLPKATLADPGLYAEAALEWAPYWTTSMGGRFDWAYTTARVASASGHQRFSRWQISIAASRCLPPM